MTGPTYEPLGDQALLVRWGDAIDADANRRVHATAARLRAVAPAWLVDCVPAYAGLAVFFDAFVVGGGEPMRGVRAAVEALVDAGDDADPASAAKVVEIPACYAATQGPDLDDVAAATGLSVAQVIERHAGVEYRVAMLGFSPGFPYLLGLDATLAVPRLATPRVRIPAGSIGIGGAQTGVYPNEGPGGWRLIARTPLALFDPHRASPSLLQPGDRVRFVPIDEARFAALADRA